MVDDLNRVHRLFLQAIANHGAVPKTRALEIMEGLQDKYGVNEIDVNETTLNEYVDAINEALKDLQQNISFIRMDWNTPPEEYLVFCCTFSSTSLSLPIPYSPSECNYLKWLIELIVVNDDHSIPMISAINASSPLSQAQASTKKITKQRAEELLKEWTVTGYLYTDEANQSITLGPRTIGEFGRILLQTYSNVLQSCTMCNNLLMKPLTCPNGDCETVMDNQCASKILSKSSKCPTCKSPWSL